MRASVKGKGHSRCHQRPRNKRSEKFVLNEDPSSGRQGEQADLATQQNSCCQWDMEICMEKPLRIAR